MSNDVDPTKEPTKKNKGQLICSFCGMSNNEVMKMIAGPRVFICDKCVYLCVEIIKEDI